MNQLYCNFFSFRFDILCIVELMLWGRDWAHKNTHWTSYPLILASFIQFRFPDASSCRLISQVSIIPLVHLHLWFWFVFILHSSFHLLEQNHRFILLYISERFKVSNKKNSWWDNWPENYLVSRYLIFRCFSWIGLVYQMSISQVSATPFPNEEHVRICHDKLSLRANVAHLFYKSIEKN